LKNTRERRKLIDVRDYNRTAGDVSRLTRDLKQSLKPIIFECNTLEELYFEALKRIKPFNKYIRNNTKSIENGISKVLNHFGFYDREVKVSKYTDNGEEIVSNREKNVYQDFQRWILGYDKIPKEPLNILKSNVERHLREVNELIKHYEGLPEIRNLIDSRSFQNNHREKTIQDFYARALKERQAILDYYLDGVYERALEKSQAKILGFGFLDPFDFWNDYPYETGRGRFGSNIDYRNINCVSHRITEVFIDEIGRFMTLYRNDKPKFYKQIFKRKSVENYFQSIFYHLDLLPVSDERHQIFNELKKLFNKKNWLAFYALALPQVEGLFSEMVLSLNPRSTAIRKALPDKVRVVRPDYYLSSSYFDYFEYELPNQRNTFMHTGKSDDFEMKSYDMLTDLEHILTAFASLENPFVNLNRILRIKDPSYFSNYSAFVEFYTVLENLHADHRNNEDIKNKIKEFINNFIIKNSAIDSIIVGSSEAMTGLVDEFWEKCVNRLSKFGLPNEIASINEPKIRSLMKINDFNENTESIFLYESQDLEKIIELNSFFQGSLKHLFNGEIPDTHKDDFDKYNQSKSKIKVILNLQKQLQNQSLK